MDDALSINPGTFCPLAVFCLLRVSNFKRPTYEVNLSYVTDDVSDCVRKSISKPRSCGFEAYSTNKYN